MMIDEEISSAVDALDKAEKTQVQTGLLSRKFPEMTMDDAYNCLLYTSDAADE